VISLITKSQMRETLYLIWFYLASRCHEPGSALVQVTGWHHNTDGTTKWMALVSVWHQRNNDTIRKITPTIIWYELASNIILHAYCYNNNYVNYSRYEPRDMYTGLQTCALSKMVLLSLHSKSKFYITS